MDKRLLIKKAAPTGVAFIFFAPSKGIRDFYLNAPAITSPAQAC